MHGNAGPYDDFCSRVYTKQGFVEPQKKVSLPSLAEATQPRLAPFSITIWRTEKPSGDDGPARRPEPPPPCAPTARVRSQATAGPGQQMT